MKLKPELVEDWKKAHKFLSVQLSAAGAGILALWPEIPDDMKTALGPDTLRYVAMIGFGLIVVGRMLKQGSSAAVESQDGRKP